MGVAPYGRPSFDPGSTMRTFDSFDFDPQVLSNLEELGFEKATPIQAEAMAPLLAGKDIIAQARTGSGKTAAFGLPMIENFKEGSPTPRALVLCPTRELALQVTDALRTFAKKLPIRIMAIYGGAPYPPQLKALRNGMTIVVGTPGRVIDHISRGSFITSGIEMLVLDEADEMLRMGFMDEVETVLEALPKDRQIALFSATMPTRIESIAKRFLREPQIIKVESHALTVDHIEQRWLRVPNRHKPEAILRLLQGEPRGATLIFCRTRAGCAQAADDLTAAGMPADSIHGDLNQAARERVLNRFRSKKLNILVATDVAARGLDVSHITHVINLDYPNDAETYVHRIGRTGRAGASGKAITFVTPGEQRKLRFLKQDTGATINEMDVPSAKDIGALQRANLEQVLAGHIQSTDLAQALEWLDETVANSDLSLEEIAAAAAHMLSDRMGLNHALNPAPQEPEPRKRAPQERDWDRGGQDRGGQDRGGQARGGQDRTPHDKDPMNEVELFIATGSRYGTRPGDIVGAIANDFNLRGSDIGRIHLLDSKAFVGMTKATAEAILAKADSVEIRGRSVHLSLARGSNDRPTQFDGGDERPRRDFAGKPSFSSKGGPWNKGNKPFRRGGKPGGGFKKGGPGGNKPYAKKPFNKTRKG